MSGKPGASPLPADELHERKQDLELPGRFGEYLRFAQGSLLKAFREADQDALHAQKNHRGVTIAAALFGTFAILASALTHIFRTPLLLSFELGSALLSAVAVLLGIIAGWQKRWLLSRYKAEQYRLLKFDFLTEPALWTKPDDAWQHQLEDRIHEIEAIEDGDLEHQSKIENVAKSPLTDLESAPARQREEVWRYYVERRLEFQIHYFSRIAANEPQGWLGNSRIGPMLFFLTVTLLAYHLFLEIRLGENADRLFLILSLLVPALWSGVRTFRSANQFGRNRARSAAKMAALRQVARRLEVTPPPLGTVFQEIAVAEAVLASDQGEWLRLMNEAEWYG
jgi:hypothetical protein